MNLENRARIGRDSAMSFVASFFETVYRLYIHQLSQSSSSHTWNWVTFVTQRPSDPGIQRPGDPVDPVTLFYNELQMSTYV